MKARVKETGEIIEVQMLYPVTYSRLDGNHKIIEEYDEDELGLIIPPRPKMVSLDRVCEWLENNLCCYIGAQDFTIDHQRLEKDFRKEMED